MDQSDSLLPKFLSRKTYALLLEKTKIARLATVRDDGSPHIVPIVFAEWLNALWMPIDGKPKLTRSLARLHHIKRSPRVSLLLDEYHEDWEKLWWLRIDAHAMIYDNLSTHAECEKIKYALFEKYPQYREEASVAKISALVCFTPTRIRAWASRGFTDLS